MALRGDFSQSARSSVTCFTMGSSACANRAASSRPCPCRRPSPAHPIRHKRCRPVQTVPGWCRPRRMFHADRKHHVDGLRPAASGLAAGAIRFWRQQRRNALMQQLGTRCSLRVARTQSACATALSSPSSRPCASAAASQRPSLVMPIGITSNFLRSIAFRIDAAESSETSCSPLRPPNRTPTRSFFAID